jgi:DNA replication and repair protein RecF
MSELDSTRRRRLSELVRSEGQALITTTDVDHVPGADGPDVALLEVAAGSVARVDRGGGAVVDLDRAGEAA